MPGARKRTHRENFAVLVHRDFVRVLCPPTMFACDLSAGQRLLKTIDEMSEYHSSSDPSYIFPVVYLSKNDYQSLSLPIWRKNSDRDILQRLP